MVAALLFGSFLPFPGVYGISNEGNWTSADFQTSDGKITGFSVKGLERLQDSKKVFIPFILGVDGIADDAFLGREFEALLIPDEAGIKSIGSNAFNNVGLTTLILPSSLREIGEQAFMGNSLGDWDSVAETGFDFSSLSNSSFTTLAKGVFMENNFTSVTLPSNIVRVEELALAGNGITTLVAPQLTDIGAQAFFANKLKEVNLPNVSAIADDAFDQNDRVVKITTPEPHTGVSSHFAGGNGYVLNPVTVTVHLRNAESADPLNPDPIGQPDKILGGDDGFLSGILFERGTDVAVNAPAVYGWSVQAPTTQTVEHVGLDSPGGTPTGAPAEVTFLYNYVQSDPTINVVDHVILPDSAYTNAELLAWAAVTPAEGRTIASVTVNPTQITAAQTIIHSSFNVTYTATDDVGNVAVRTITVRVEPDLMGTPIPKADGTESLWTYADFVYATQTVTVTIDKYLGGTYTESVTGLTVTGFSAQGNTKYTGNAAARAYLVLPGINPDTGEAVKAISSSGTGGAVLFNSKNASNVPGAIDLSNMTALEIIGDKAFSTDTNNVNNTNGAYAEVNFGTKGARLTKLRAIGSHAFRWNKIVSLDLSDLVSLKIIGDYTFSDTSGNTLAHSGGHDLQAINFDNMPALLAIGGGAYTSSARTFLNSQLRSIDLSGCPNLEQLGIATFCAAASSESITITPFPLDLSMLDKLKIIGQHCFRDYPLSTLNISGMDSLIEIGGNNFGHLGSATLEIKDNPKLTTIAPVLFNNSIPTRLPLAVNSITELIIDNCDSLVSLPTPTNDTGLDDLPLLKTVRIINNEKLTTIPESVTTATNGCFFGDLTNIKTVEIANNAALTSIGNKAFQAAAITSLTIANNPALTTIGDYAFYKNRITELDLSTNPMLTAIGQYAFSESNYTGQIPGTITQDFYDNNGGALLTSLNLTGLTKLRTIGNYAFCRAGLTSLDLSGNTALTTVGQRAFRDSPLTSLAFPQSIVTIDILAFGSYAAESLVVEDLPNLYTIGAGAFNWTTEDGAQTLKSLVLRNLPVLRDLRGTSTRYGSEETAFVYDAGADGIMGTDDDSLSAAAFRYLYALESVVLDNLGLISIPPECFGNSPLTQLTISNMPNLKSIGIYADKLPDGITDVSTGSLANRGAFESAKLTELSLVNLPQLETIGNEAFLNSPLQSLALSGLPKLKYIGERAFNMAVGLKELDLSNLTSLEIIGDGAFENSPIETLSLTGDTALKKICYKAFYKNQLTSLDLSNLTSLEIIGSRAFSDGSMPGTIGGGGALITSIKLDNLPSLRMIGSVDHGANGDDYKKESYYLCGEGARTFYGAALTNLDLSGCPNLESIGFAVFINAPLQSLDLSAQKKLKYIGMLAFGAYAGTELTISDLPELYEIGGMAFSSGRVATNLTSLTLENLPKLTFLAEQQAFLYDENGLAVNDNQGYNTTHYGPAGNTARKAYSGLSTLTLKNLPKLQSIPPFTFSASPLTQLSLEGDLSSLEVIGYNAFSSAKLTQLDLNNLTGLLRIEDYAFENVPLTELHLDSLAHLRSIGARAFAKASLNSLDLRAATEFEGFTFPVNRDDVLNPYSPEPPVSSNSAFASSFLNYVIIGGIGTSNASSNQTDTLYIRADAQTDNAYQSFNKNNGVPVYCYSPNNVRTADGYLLAPVNILVHYKRLSDGETIAPDAVTRAEYNFENGTVSLFGKPIFGYQHAAVSPTPAVFAAALPAIEHLGDLNYLEPGNEYTFYYEEYTPTDSSLYHIYQHGITTKDYIGNILQTSVDLNNSGLAQDKKIGAGWSVQVAYDPTRVVFMADSKQDGIHTTSCDPAAGIITITFTDEVPTGSFGLSLFWQLISGPTEQGREFPLVATLINPDNDAVAQSDAGVGPAYGMFVDGEGSTGTQKAATLSGIYKSPGITKFARTSTMVEQNKPRSRVGGEENSLDGPYNYNENRYIEQDKLWIEYTVNIGSSSRFISAITYTDYLPTYYANVDGVKTIATAYFDPALNPGWYDNGDGTVSITYSQLQTVTPPTPTLVLYFPNAWEDQEVVNTIGYVSDIYEPAYGDYEHFSGKDDIASLFVAIPPGNFVKVAEKPHRGAVKDYFSDGTWAISPAIAANDNPDGFAAGEGIHADGIAAWETTATDGGVISDPIGWFYDSKADKGASADNPAEFKWSISLTGRNGDASEWTNDTTRFTDLVFTDVLYDSRMKMVSADINGLGPATLTAYDIDGNVVLTRNNVTSKIIFPKSLQESIVRVTFSDISYSVKKNETVSVFIYTALKDPSITWESETDNGTDMDGHYDPLTRTADDYFWNLGEASYNEKWFDESEVQQTVPHHVDDWDCFRMINIDEGIGISKSAVEHDGNTDTIYMAGDKLDYKLKLDTFNGIDATNGGDFQMLLQNVEIIDVLPDAFVFESFTPYEQLALAAQNLRYEFVSDGYTDAGGAKHNILRITADSIRVGSLYNYELTEWNAELQKNVKRSILGEGYLGLIKGSVMATSAVSMVNRVYLDFDEDPSIIRVGTESEDLLTENGGVDGGITNGKTLTDKNPFGKVGTLVGVDQGNMGMTSVLTAMKLVRNKLSENAWSAWQTTTKNATDIAGVGTGGRVEDWAYDVEEKLYIFNNTDESVTEQGFKLYDFLPMYMDHGIVNGATGTQAERNSDWWNDVKQVTVPAGYEVWYLVVSDQYRAYLDENTMSTYNTPYHLPSQDLTGDGEIDAKDLELQLDSLPFAETAADYFSLVDDNGAVVPAAITEGSLINGVAQYWGEVDAFVGNVPVWCKEIPTGEYSNGVHSPHVIGLLIRDDVENQHLVLEEQEALEVVIEMTAPRHGPETYASLLARRAWNDPSDPAYHVGSEPLPEYDETWIYPGKRMINSFCYNFEQQTELLEAPPVYNEVKAYPASLSLTKKDIKTNSAMQGVQFTLYQIVPDGEDSDSSPDYIYISAATTGADGRLTFTELAPGDYAVREAATPAGYAANGVEYTITIPALPYAADYELDSVPDVYEYSEQEGYVVTAGTAGVQPIYNTPVPPSALRGSVMLTKYDGMTPAAPLKGVQFKISRGAISYYAETPVDPLDPEKLNTEGEYNSWSSTASTDAAGKVSFNSLLTTASGVVYTIEETAAPGSLDRIRFDLRVYPDRTEYVVGTLRIYINGSWQEPPSGYSVSDFISASGTGDGLAPFEVVARNPLVDVWLTKAGIPFGSASINTAPTDINGSFTKLGGVEFTLYEVGTGILGTDVSLGQFTTISDPADANYGKVLLPKLKVGQLYRIEENSTVPGYLENGTPTYFTVDATGKPLSYPEGLPFKSGTVVVKNIEKAKVNILKLGIDVNNSVATAKDPAVLQVTDGVKLENVSFKVYKENDPLPDSYIGEYTTDSNGIASITGLEYDEWYYAVEQRPAPSGYLGSDSPVYFKIGTDYRVLDGNGTAFAAGSVVVKNYQEPVPGKVSVSKTGAVIHADGTLSTADSKEFVSYEPLEGIKFYVEKSVPIADDSGDGLADGWTAAGSLVTDAQGKAELDGLYEGIYRIKEQPSDEAPISGDYLNNTQSYVFTVARSIAAQEFEYEFSNTAVKPIILKGDYVGTYNPKSPVDQAQLDSAYAALQAAGKNPHQVLRSDGKIDLIAGLGGAVFEMRVYDGLNIVDTALLGGWLISSNPDGSFNIPDYTTAADIPAYDGTTLSGFDGFKESLSYTFKEIQAPSGYALSDETYVYQPYNESAAMLANGGKWISLENKVVSHKISIAKYAADTRGVLPGTEFKLYYPDGTPVLADRQGNTYSSFITDSNGRLSFTDLAPGTYYLKEISAPKKSGVDYYEVKDGYYKIEISGERDIGMAEAPHQTPDNIAGNAENTVFSQVLQTEGDAYAVIYDSKKKDPFTLSISKSVTGESDPEQLWYFRVEFDPVELDGDGEPLPQQTENWQVYAQGSPVTVYISDLDDVGYDSFVGANDLIQLKTGERALIPALAEGTRYRVTETDENGAHLDGWKLTATQTVPLAQDTSDGVPDGLVSVEPDSGAGVPTDRISGTITVLDEDGTGNHVLYADNQKSKDFAFTKLALTEVNTSAPLSGAKFQVLRCGNDEHHDADDHDSLLDGSSCWQLYEQAVSGSNGYVLLPDLTLYGEELEKNIYILVETETPYGYSLPSGYWVLTVDPFAGTVGIAAVKTGAELPPAFYLLNSTLYLPNARVLALPPTGGFPLAPILVLAGLLLSGLGLLLLYRRKKTDTGKKARRGKKLAFLLGVGLGSAAILTTAGIPCAKAAAAVPEYGSIAVVTYYGQESDATASGAELNPNDAFFADSESYKPVEGVEFSLTAVTEDSGATNPLFTSQAGEKYVALSGSSEPLSAKTGANGKVIFEDLPLGVYLLHEITAPTDSSPIGDFLVSIPMSVPGRIDDKATPELDEGSDYLLYDVTVYPKTISSSATTPSEPATTKPSGGGIDTGDNNRTLWWLAATLASGFSALALVLTGRKKQTVDIKAPFKTDGGGSV
jgi:hypothetical protein